jgi:malate dehydrogenase (oxaloacetate-decarboxylating)
MAPPPNRAQHVHEGEGKCHTDREGPSGRALLADPLSDKGVAFTQEERERHGLVGMLPPAVLPLELQARRAWEQLRSQPDDLAKNVYLEQLYGFVVAAWSRRGRQRGSLVVQINSGMACPLHAPGRRTPPS